MIKNGKIFGKLNIIDAVIILVLVAGIALAGVFFVKKKVSAPKTDVLVMKFYTEEVSDFVVEHLEVGNPLYDGDQKIDLGVTTNVEIADSIAYGGLSGGSYEMVNKEGYKSALITGEVVGEKNELGAVIDGFQYGIGHSMVLRSGDAKIYLRVYDIGLKSEIEANEKEEASNQKTIVVGLEANEVNNVAANSIKVGDEIYDTTKGVVLGKITSFELSDAKVYNTTADGREVVSSKEGFSTVKILAEVTGELTENGALNLEGKTYHLAQDLQLRAGNAVLDYGYITDISLK